VIKRCKNPVKEKHIFVKGKALKKASVDAFFVEEKLN